ncbi:MAG: Mg2+ and Co2+ transporter-like protein [Leptotrichiaceae bacterium]|nr:Mg2+ and Co2+ transporter-like protein [Leptotrichiaceae bacterium]MBP6281526.1 Mg2+ and Co2+ transporter-like protein [Leptotrichiaceae bacterium]MBP7101072.1 Mg2+ and Co2+ transporter-like protein [Leptotrichiaceae bacterium]MBP9629226.1 Mg2+ and Co2+ transporter-like protein [Leptotrichiaceae bacterium]
MIKNIYSEGDKSITYAYNLTKNDYSILEEKLGMNEKKINDMTNEEIFTPRISKSDWEIYKLYYPEIKSNEKQNKFSWSEIYPLIVLKKENKIVIIDEKYFEEFYEFVEQYIELHGKNLDPDRFFLNILHRISQSLYKYVRFFIGEHDNIEILLREHQSNENLISLSEVEQGFYVYNIALRNLNYVVENINEEPEFKQFEEYIVKILQEINFTMDLSSSYCDICKTTRETYSSYISNNMNVTMKILAAVTILIAIPNMIFGFYGMNILLPLQDKGFLVLGVIISVMIGLMIILWKYMKKKIL